jgi:glycosyltransferase involved in cell wall biosynthesis
MDAISVVIPYYNRMRYISAALQSVFSQTVAPLEVLVVDDGSAPEQARFLQQFVPRVQVLRLDRNRGPAAARNTGIHAARGGLIAFLDSDDLWEPDKLEVQLRHLRDNPDCAGVHTAIRSFYPDGREAVSDPLPPRLTLRDALYQNIIRVQSLLIRTEVLRAVGGFDPRLRLCEDDDLSIRLAAAGHRIDFLPRPLVRMRRDGHDHLFSGWRRILRWKAQVAIKHRVLIDQVLGPGAARRRVARSVRKAGIHEGRLAGRLVYGMGWLLGGLETQTD